MVQRIGHCLKELALQTTIDILKIPSPTGQEERIFNFIFTFIQSLDSNVQFFTTGRSLIAQLSHNPALPHIALIGHTDVVPEYFEPYIENECLFGAGASDMKASLGVYLELFKNHRQSLCKNYNVSLVFYEKEEQTPMEQNGLYFLIQKFPQFFKSLDLAIVGEPTDLDIHLGCLGSLHVEFKILGQACHSARPWNGENALYKSLPVLQALSEIPVVSHDIFGVTFKDVLHVTEFCVESGRTSLPGWVKGNVNFRFSPHYSVEEAQTVLQRYLDGCGLYPSQYEYKDIAPAGRVIETPFFKDVIQSLGKPLKAKQAWTDVAQLTALGVPAINFGAGLTSEAHKINEMIPLSHISSYYQILENLLLKTKVNV